MGDQLISYDKFDGLQSAMIGLLNSGLSGFSLGHSDIGGYTAVNEPIVPKYLRDKQLLHRWIEMTTFSDPIMRSHPSSAPDTNFQIWDDNDSILFLKKFTLIHVALADYKMFLMNQAYEFGRPFTRPMMLHFENDIGARSIIDQFMLGENILVAPAFKPNMTERQVYLPGPAKWQHMWTGEVYDIDSSETFTIKCDLGYPAVFYRDTDAYEISKVLE